MEKGEREKKKLLEARSIFPSSVDIIPLFFVLRWGKFFAFFRVEKFVEIKYFHYRNFLVRFSLVQLALYKFLVTVLIGEINLGIN
jgi:hypothetical protein